MRRRATDRTVRGGRPYLRLVRGERGRGAAHGARLGGGLNWGVVHRDLISSNNPPSHGQAPGSARRRRTATACATPRRWRACSRRSRRASRRCSRSRCRGARRIATLRSRPCDCDDMTRNQRPTPPNGATRRDGARTMACGRHSHTTTTCASQRRSNLRARPLSAARATRARPTPSRTLVHRFFASSRTL